MSVKQLESAVAALPPDERQEFIHWLDDHRHELVDEADDFALTAEQKAELLQRQQSFFVDWGVEQTRHLAQGKLAELFHQSAQNRNANADELITRAVFARRGLEEALKKLRV